MVFRSDQSFLKDEEEEEVVKISKVRTQSTILAMAVRRSISCVMIKVGIRESLNLDKWVNWGRSCSS